MPFIPIREDTAPYIVFDGESTKAVYDHARVYVELLRSHFVRVTQRGVLFGIAERLRPVFATDSDLTESIACRRHPHALCETDDGVLVLPTGVVDFPGAPAPSLYLASFGGNSPCTSRATGRAYNSTDTRYEVSLCDIIDGRIDLIYDLGSQTLHWRKDVMTMLEYVPLALVAVYLMSCTSVNIVKFVHRQPYETSKVTLAASALVVLYTLYSLVAGSLRFVATDSDLYLLLLLCGFVSMEVALQLFLNDTGVNAHAEDRDKQDTDERAPINYVGGISVNIASLLLLTLPVHYSFDNPYTPVLSVLLGVRSWTRFVAVLHSANITHLLLATVDLATFAAVLQVGIGHAAYDAYEAAAEQVQICLTSVVFGQLIKLHQRQTAPPRK